MRNLLPHGREGGRKSGGAGPQAVSAAGIHNPAIRRRWELQRAAAGLLSDKSPAIDRYGNPAVHFDFRVAMCHRGTDGGAPGIKRSADRANARFVGLQTCGSVWHCPICSPKVAAARRDEMQEAMNAWKARGGEVYFLTYTSQHDAESGGMDCAESLKKMAAVLSRFKSLRVYRSALESAGAVGAIRALEPTFGELNGWHIHTHELLFAQPGHGAALSRLRKAWARQLIKRGMSGLKPGDIGREKFRKLRALLQRSLTVQNGDYATEYILKFGREPELDRGAWGLAAEMTSAHRKTGRLAGTDGAPQRCGHASPWALLNDYLDGDRRSGALFREYAIAFHGRRQLYWSPKLRELFFGLVDRSDDELAAADDARCDEFVCDVLPSQWALVIAHEARFDLLRAAASDGAEGVRALLADLDGRPPPRRSDFFTEGRFAPPPMTTYEAPAGRAVYVER